ncbi:unnamed protein product [Trichobilharzia regenti]|nr:unnamed protein product [Trichobilharzia regenti]
MHNLNNNDELHSSAYHHVKRRNSEIHEYSKSMHNSTNNMIMIPSSCASDCVGDGGASGNHQYVKLLPENRIVSKRDHAVIESVQSVNHNNNNYAVMTTATTTTSNAVRNSDTMNQLLARLHSMLRDQTDSGFIETNDLTAKATNSNKMLSQNFSSAFL